MEYITCHEQNLCDSFPISWQAEYCLVLCNSGMSQDGFLACNTHCVYSIGHLNDIVAMLLMQMQVCDKYSSVVL